MERRRGKSIGVGVWVRGWMPIPVGEARLRNKHATPAPGRVAHFQGFVPVAPAAARDTCTESRHSWEGCQWLPPAQTRKKRHRRLRPWRGIPLAERDHCVYDPRHSPPTSHHPPPGRPDVGADVGGSRPAPVHDDETARRARTRRRRRGGGQDREESRERRSAVHYLDRDAWRDLDRGTRRFRGAAFRVGGGDAAHLV